MNPALAQPIKARLDKIADQMKPWAAAGGYFNFAERRCELDAILPAETCKRLAEVKRRWDPDDMIVTNHPLPAAG